MPVYNWFRVFEDKDYKYALLDINAEVDDRIQDALLVLNKDYCEVFGVDGKFIDYTRAQGKVELLKIKYALTKDKGLLTWIKIAELDLQKKFKVEVITKSFDSVIEVEKYMGFKINLKETTVFEFYSYLKNYGRDARKRVPKKNDKA